MANVQATQPNVANAHQEPLTPITSLLRFLYTGTSASSITLTAEPNIENIEETLACVINMATARALLPISTIRKVYQGKQYRRVDEVLIALAYCAKQTHSEELRKLANDEAITLIVDQEDFLHFVFYCIKISSTLRGGGHYNFGHGMCRLVEKWYAKWTPLEIAKMFGEHRGFRGVTHQSVIRKSHMRTKKTPPPPPPAEAPAANAMDVAAPSASSTEASTTNETSTTPPSSSTVQSAPANVIDDDREQVFQFVFCQSGQEYLTYLEDKVELGAGAQHLRNLQILKTNENVDVAVESIREHNVSLGQLPAHLLEKYKIWEALLPSLTSRTLLHKFNTLKDHGFLNEDSAFIPKFLEVFGNPTKFKMEKVCPVSVYIQKIMYDKNKRHLGTKKAEFYEKKILKRKISVNQLISERLSNMFHTALFNATPAPAKFMVVMDLRRGNAKKPILRNKHINCFEASFLLAYSIFVREKDSLVYTFTDTKDKLEALHEMMPNNNFGMAKEAVDLYTAAHTFQSLATPIAQATAMKKKVDMFVVIVDSVARFCRQGQVPIKEFTEYKAKFNDRAKYVVVNLTRPTPDLKIPAEDRMKGFFEICGFTADTAKIIHALATHSFT